VGGCDGGGVRGMYCTQSKVTASWPAVAGRNACFVGPAHDPVTPHL
jgi:hypothetical protein